MEEPKHNINSENSGPDQSSKRTRQIKILRVTLGMLLGGLALYGGIKIHQKSHRHEEAIAEKDGPLNFVKLGEKLRTYANGLDPVNQKNLNRVIALLESNMSGVKVDRAESMGDPRIKARTHISTDYRAPFDPTVILLQSWDPDNGFDLALFIHELLHVTDSGDDRKNLTEEDWEKIYKAPGDATEIRTELKAWELSLVLANKLSGGLFDRFYGAVRGLSTKDQGAANRIAQEYADQIAIALKAPDRQKKQIKKWLEFYYSYRISEKFGLDCRWSYNFVTQIAGEYNSANRHLYELDAPAETQGKSPNQCLYPLVHGPYKSFRPYVDLGRGLIGPTQRPVKFNSLP